MKASAKKSSTTTSTTATQAANQPFFAKANGGDFFAPATGTAAPAVQTKLTVNEPGDKFEQEADSMADKVMRMPAPAPMQVNEEKLQRQPEDKLQKQEEEKIQKAALPEEKIQKVALSEEKLQKQEAEELAQPKSLVNQQFVARKPSAESKGVYGQSPQVSPATADNIHSLNGGGSPLPRSARSFFEPRFGTNFNQVRVHTDTRAAEAAKSVNARAFTFGRNIAFGAGQYAPESQEGQRLLGHELMHTLQQTENSETATIRRNPDEQSASVVEKQVSDQSMVETSEPTHIAVVNGRIVVLSAEEFEVRVEAVKRHLLTRIDLALGEAEFGRKEHIRHMENVRGTAGFLSDWWNDIIPPWSGMWGHPISLFKKAKTSLETGAIKEAYRVYEIGRMSLIDSQNNWRTYMRQTIEGAEATVTTLEYVRDGAIAVEVGLITFGGAYAIGGGGALVTGGATLLGVSSATLTAALLPTSLGEDVRGTLKEINKAGVAENLKLASYGLAGMIMGAGEALEGIGKSLLTLFTNPKKFVEDLFKLPQVISQLYANRQQLWLAFSRLPPEQQASQVGRFAGQIEGMLISIGATQAAGAALKAEAAGAASLAGGQAQSLLGPGGSIAIAIRQLNVIRVETLVIAGGQTAHAAIAAGLPITVPRAYAMGMQDVLDKFVEGPSREAMSETGKTGAGMQAKPKHHTLPKEHRTWFEERGFKGDLDIDNFTVKLERWEHEAIHGGGNYRLGRTTGFEWNTRVMNELKKAESMLGGRKLTVEEITQIVEKLMKEYRIPRDYVHYKE